MRPPTALAVALALFALFGCGKDVGVPDGTAHARPGPAPVTPAIKDLTCKTQLRGSAIYDYFLEGGGRESPEAAAQSRADGDEVVVEEPVHGQTVAWVLRPDGTAHTRLDLLRLPDDTWRVVGLEVCETKDHPSM